MQISNETIQILKNFASINNSILVREGDIISTITTAKNIFARAQVQEHFPKEVAIYDLGSLLALLTLRENQEIEFGDKSVTINKEGAGTFEYYYSSPEVVKGAPDKTIEVDEFYKFKLTAEDVAMINKAAAITSAPNFSVTCKNQQVMLTIGNRKELSTNNFKKTIGTGFEDFDVFMGVENFKIIPDAYEVTVSKKKFLHFKHETKNLQYWIACDPESII